MVKLEWGQKRHCISCQCKFYDLNRSPIVCPKCHSPFEVVGASRKGRRHALKGGLPVTEDETLLLPDLEGDVELVDSLENDVIEDAEDLSDNFEDAEPQFDKERHDD